VVGLTHGQVIKVAGDVVGGLGVGVPLIVAAGGGTKRCIALVDRDDLFIPVPTCLGQMINLETQLALRT
jgi:hypothetical protein